MAAAAVVGLGPAALGFVELRHAQQKPADLGPGRLKKASGVVHSRDQFKSVMIYRSRH